MRQVLLDADAFLCLRKLGLITMFCGAPEREDPFAMTEYVARHELNSIDAVIRKCEADGCLRVHPVGGGLSAAGGRWRQLRREGVDKGEAEAIAWAMGIESETRPVFVSRETKALAHATARGVAAADVFALICAAVQQGWISVETAKATLVVWDDKGQEICRPKDYTTFDECFERRRASVSETFAQPPTTLT